MSSSVATHPEAVRAYYASLKEKLDRIRKTLGRPLTWGEKILLSHADRIEDLKGVKKGESFLMLRPDRVAMQDATAQMAILQFIQSGKKRVSVPSTVHCDHLIRAHAGAAADMDTATNENREVYSFLKSASEKYGIGFWGPGSGIIHQVVLENYAFPGGLMIGTDSHTPNAGGLGMCAIGVGGADAVDVMAGMPWELKYPEFIGVHLKGKMSGWTSPKDVILKLLGILTVKGGTNKIVEYFGPGCETISATGKGTICNMGAELGATTSTFPYDCRIGTYLRATGRAELAQLADEYASYLCADPEVLKDPKKYYDSVIEIDLSELEPRIVGPHSPDVDRPVSELAAEVKKENYPDKISAALIGSCTNSSYEDIYRAAHVAKSATAQGLKATCSFYITPGSTQIYDTIKRDGLLADLEAFGGQVLANACGPCIGQWKRDDIKEGEVNTIVTSFNRNFRGRNDANSETLSFITSPEMVVAYAATGSLSFDPKSPGKFKLAEPCGPELPEKGFVRSDSGYTEPAQKGDHISVQVSPSSERLQILEPFKKWTGQDFKEHLVLAKTKGKTTTDHISPAGRWLRYRGHLDRISDNMLLGATNAFTQEIGKGTNHVSGETGLEFTKIARAYKAAGKPWVIVGDENYGEGSSREHAAMSPRFLGATTVVARSFARIHETNLKKQGVLALTFANASDYDKVREKDRISIRGLTSFSPGKQLEMHLKHDDGSEESFKVNHTYNAEQIAWFQAGSALNLIAD